MSAYQPIYTTYESVKVRLRGKVAFQECSGVSNPRQMPDDLLAQMIADAETAVEQDLRGRYAVPFRSIAGGSWAALPDHTRRAIRTIVDQKACLLILADSFGTGTHINADGYMRSLTENYDLLLKRLLGQDMEGENFGEKRFRRTPPLEDLMLAATNSADSGFAGLPMDAGQRSPIDQNRAGFAASRINDPSVSIWNLYGGRRGSR